ncbi:hypothetical protein CERSUDRAFT_147812 [Gelatoporia subvermispora B]|uniref:Alpha/beta hydrolase fold-3 domain-containing protein n=1 Tax=Ceriporiopsis subvermispora (strain B) TaxID=914234 RepID=M2PZ35_CERS8|nr:hypothetical protein CERSUDRAFT_147812 [Gelatoporia subvermispora B]
MPWPLSLLSLAGPSHSPGPTDLKSPQPVTSALASPIDLLQHFESPGVPPPPCARVGDPKLKQREGIPLSLWQLPKLGAFAAVKATSIVKDLLASKIWGPPKKSWGVEMTILWSIMKDVGQHSHLADIVTIRMLMSIGGYVPLPSDALVTPVTFRVRKRNLRGILADFDAAEDGKRELSGEWIIGKRTYQRLQREWRAAKLSGTHKQGQQSKKNERVVLYLHGGAYYMFSAATHRLLTIPLSKYLDARLFAVDYRLAPETRFPGPLHDAVSAYFRLIDDLRIPPENILVAGDSAGGGLTLALLMYLRDNDYPLPSGAILMSPWVDLTMSCDSWDSNAPYDIVPRPQPGDHLNPIACYLGEHMEKYLTHPYASPLFGDFRGLPPLLIQAGDAEVLRDEITLLAHKATLAGVGVRHELYEDCVHVFQSIPFLDAAPHAFASCRDFVRNFLPQWQSRSPQELEGETEESMAHEIDTDAARVVSGDGTESISASVPDQGQESERESEHHRPAVGRAQSSLEAPSLSPCPSSLGSMDEEPSWAARWPSPPSSDEETVRARTPSAPVETRQRQRHHVRAHTHSYASARPALDRLQSTLSVIANASSFTASSAPRRSASYQHLSVHSPPSSPSASANYAHSHTPEPLRTPRRRRRISSLSMASNAPAPPPGPRRADASHPDISSLCRQYADSGPAHATTRFTSASDAPDPAQHAQNARSRALSSASSKEL